MRFGGNVKRLLTMGIVAILVAMSLVACNSGGDKVTESGDIDENNVNEVCGILKDAGLSNTGVFEEWVRTGTSDNASDEEGSGFTDADCRMTVMLLAGDIIRYDSVEDNYSGDYLMFDLNLIENDEAFSMLKDREALFTTMFGEMPISSGGFDKSLAERWSSHGIRTESDRCSVISILFKAYDREEAFVGHTGILVDCRDSDSVDSNYVFVEKIGFGDPFRISMLESDEELLEILSQRPDYSSEEGEPKAVVYKDAEPLGELKS